MKKYSELIAENEEPLPRIKLAGKFVTHHISHEDSTASVIHHTAKREAIVTDVHTPEHNRGKGHANELMKKVTDHLDHHKLNGRLAPVPMNKDTSKKRLVSLYNRHGFKKAGFGIDRIRKHKGD